MCEIVGCVLIQLLVLFLWLIHEERIKYAITTFNQLFSAGFSNNTFIQEILICILEHSAPNNHFLLNL